MACYYGCLLSRPPEIVAFDNPEHPTCMDNLLLAAGAEPVAWPYDTECCGASLSMTRTGVVNRLAHKLLSMARQAGADCIAVACPLCQVNLDLRQTDAVKAYGDISPDAGPLCYTTPRAGSGAFLEGVGNRRLERQRQHLACGAPCECRADGRIRMTAENKLAMEVAANGNGNGNGEETVGAVMVCGGGVAGIQASLDLSAAGFRVFLVEQSPTIGGNMARLDKTFPTGDCATCIISPKLVECMRDYNIDVLTMADVTALEGRPGHFTAEVRKRPRSVKPEKCTGCGDCWTICPVRHSADSPPPFQPSEPLGDADAAELRRILAEHDGGLRDLMPVLQEIERTYGHLPRRILEHLACSWGLRLAEIVRVASFYDRFRLQPAGPARGRSVRRHVMSQPRRGALCGNGWKRRSASSPARPIAPAASRCKRCAAWGCAPCRRR